MGVVLGEGATMTKESGPCVLCIGTDLANLNLRGSSFKKLGWNASGSGSGPAGLYRFGRGRGFIWLCSN